MLGYNTTGHHRDNRAALLLPIAVLATCLSMASGQVCGADRRFPNIEYLGRGYNLIKGNPNPFKPASMDPGWVSPSIFDMEDVSEGHTFGTCLLPNAATPPITGGACSYDGAFHEVGDAASLQQSLSTDISFDATIAPKTPLFGLTSGKFSASHDFQQASSEASSSDKITNVIIARCESYKTELRSKGFGPLKTFYGNLSDDFVADVSYLPLSVSDADPTGLSVLADFIDKYGTHFSTKITMGGKAARYYVGEKSLYNKQLSGGTDMSVGGSISAGSLFSGNSNIKKHTDYNSSVAYNSTMQSFQVSCVGAGGHCPAASLVISADGFPDPGPWVDQVAANPVPLAYTLMTLDEVLTAARFPSDPNVTQRSAALRLFLAEHYCKVAPCTLPNPNGYWLRSADMTLPWPVDSHIQQISDQPHTGIALAVLNDALHALGGVGTYISSASDGGYDSYATNWIFDPVRNSWAAGTPMRDARAGHTAVTLGGKIIVYGGYDQSVGSGVGRDSFSSIGSTEIYDPAQSTWTSVKDGPQRSWHAAAVVGDMMYVVGGTNCYMDAPCYPHVFSPPDTGFLSSASRYNPANDSWIELPPMSTPRYGPAAAEFNGELWVFGGFDGNWTLDTVEVFDPLRNTWGPCWCVMLTPRMLHAGLAWNGQFWLLGGFGANATRYNGAGGTHGWKGNWAEALKSVHAFNPTTYTWNTAIPAMTDVRTAFKAAVLGEELFVVRGGPIEAGTYIEGNVNQCGSVERYWNATPMW